MTGHPVLCFYMQRSHTGQLIKRRLEEGDPFGTVLLGIVSKGAGGGALLASSIFVREAHQRTSSSYLPLQGYWAVSLV